MCGFTLSLVGATLIWWRSPFCVLRPSRCARGDFAAAVVQMIGLPPFRVICETKATADRSGAHSLEMAGCHHERHTIPQLEDPGLSLCVGKHSPCLSILEQDTDPWQLYGGCSAADLLKESGKRQGSWIFVFIII